MAARKPSGERRREIALAVLKIIGERGLTSLTTASLSEEVGVTTGALFRHFASLEEIFQETVRRAVDQVEATFPDASLPPLGRLMGLARNRIELLSSAPGLSWLLRSEQAYLTLPAESVTALQTLVKRSRTYLLRAIRDAQAEGTVRDDIEPDVLLVPVMGTIHALAGMPGVHRLSRRTDSKKRDAALAGLERMLAPPFKEAST